MVFVLIKKNISIKIFDGDDATMKKRNTSLKKEKLIMISASAFVLTALTMSGVYMRRLNEETDESRIGTEHLATQELSEKVSEIAEYKGSGHGGGDHALVRDFVRAVSAQDEKLLSSTIDVSIESHVMGFMAEKSRKSMKKVKI